MDKARIEKELEALKEKIDFSYQYPEEHQGEITPAMKYDAWLQRFGNVSPKQVYEILSYKCEEALVRLPLDETNTIRLKLGSQKDYCKTILKIGAPLAQADGFSLHSMNVFGKMGAGSGKRVLANLDALLEAQFPNIGYIDISACSTGAYAWAKFGFTPYEVDDSMRRHWRSKKTEILEQLTPQESQEIDKMISSSNPKSIWSLADISKPIHDPYSLEETTVGKYLLADGNWEGQLDLTDKDTVDRFKGYLSKLDVKRTISGADKGSAELSV